MIDLLVVLFWGLVEIVYMFFNSFFLHHRSVFVTLLKFLADFNKAIVKLLFVAVFEVFFHFVDVVQNFFFESVSVESFINKIECCIAYKPKPNSARRSERPASPRTAHCCANLCEEFTPYFRSEFSANFCHKFWG